MPSCLPQAERVLADRGYDADWFREALKDKGIKACIPGPGGAGRHPSGTTSATTSLATVSR
jgi:transposase